MDHTFAVLFLISCFLSTSAAGNNGEDIRLPLRADADGFFYVTVGLGTPSRDFTLFFDTGSSLTWVQCEPCSGDCYPGGRFFEPPNSSTYSDPTCDPTCDYHMEYRDESFSKGSYIKDTLTLSPKGVLEGFIFGCARTIGGSFGEMDGLLGVGPGSESLLAQTNIQYFSTFCYCLPASQGSSGFLVFGVQAFETCQPDRMTPLAVHTDEDKYTSYYVQLLGISIGQQRIEIPSSSKTIMDSGTLISRLTSSAYSALTSAFQEIMSGYTPAPPTEDFDVCYYNHGGDQSNLTPPEMMLHFENSVDVKLDPSAVAYSESDSRVCLPFMESEHDDENIIGNLQHRELQVFYEIDNGNLAFSNGGCTT